jgi:predicted O-methyltransferase YrrM
VSNRTIGLSDELHAYVVAHASPEHEVLRGLRERTAKLPQHNMQISRDQGALLALLVRLLEARRCLEIGTFTGYSSTAVGLALPPDGSLICCDVSEEWTRVARQAWQDAGIAERVQLRLGPAVDTLDTLLAEGRERTFDFAFIDADKSGYDSYYERCLRLVRPGGLIAIDNVLWSGRVVDPDADDGDTVAIRTLNDKVTADARVESLILPVADGLTLARVLPA